MTNHQITDDAYNALKNQYGKYGSWALWQKTQDGVQLHKVDYSIDPFINDLENSNFRETHLTNAGIILALNWAEREALKGQDWTNFHDTRSVSQDYKLAKMIQGTPFEGSYMTDIIKDHPETNSQKVANGVDAEELAANAKLFQKEIDLVAPQYLIVCGVQTENAVTKMINDGLIDLHRAKVQKIKHYSAAIGKEELHQINEQLKKIPLA